MTDGKTSNCAVLRLQEACGARACGIEGIAWSEDKVALTECPRWNPATDILLLRACRLVASLEYPKGVAKLLAALEESGAGDAMGCAFAVRAAAVTGMDDAVSWPPVSPLAVTLPGLQRRRGFPVRTS